jgi:transcriptional regulator PpsR
MDRSVRNLNKQLSDAHKTLSETRQGATAPSRRGSRATTSGGAVGLPALDASATLAALQAGNDVVLLLDANGRIEQVWSPDERLQQLARQQWVGRDWGATVTIECLDKISQMLGDAGAQPPRARQVNHVLQGKGEWPVLYIPVRLDSGGRAAQVLALGRDLSGLVHAQQRMVQAQQAMERDYARLRDAQARYRHLFQSCSEAVLVVDAQTMRVIEGNPAATRLLEPSPGKLVDQPFAALFAPAHEQALRSAMAAALRFGQHDQAVPCAPRKAAAPASRSPQLQAWVSAFAQDGAEFFLVRLVPQEVRAGKVAADQRANGHNGAALLGEGAPSLSSGSYAAYSAYWKTTREAVVFTDGQGRVRESNPAFMRLAEMHSTEQLRQQSLERWLGRTGVELGVLLGQLRDTEEGHSTGVMPTELRGDRGSVTPVQVQATVLAKSKSGEAIYAFCLREDGGSTSGGALAEGDALGAASRIPRSSEQLAALIGRVPLKQIVAESSDLIERMSIQSALHVTRDNRVLAAQLLGLSRQSLYVKMRRFGLGDLPSLEDELAAFQAQGGKREAPAQKSSRTAAKTKPTGPASKKPPSKTASKTTGKPAARKRPRPR